MFWFYFDFNSTDIEDKTLEITFDVMSITN